MITKILIGGLIVKAIRHYKPFASETVDYVLGHLSNLSDMVAGLQFLTIVI